MEISVPVLAPEYVLRCLILYFKAKDVQNINTLFSFYGILCSLFMASIIDRFR